MLEKIKTPENQEDNELLEKILVENIEKIRKEGTSLGQGRTAIVCYLEELPNVCLKLIKNRAKARNSGIGEMEIQEFLASHNISVPKAICAMRDEENDYIFMETISGFSLLDLAEDDLSSILPEEFDFNNFFKELGELVKKMHELKIFHRDLQPGNVMVDEKGKPVIIDFGESTRCYLSSEDPYSERMPDGSIRKIISDEDRLRELRLEIGKYLREKGFFDKNKK